MKNILSPTIYRGRFAPSPTGPLHFGSLITAICSYLEAKTRGGEWLVRIENLDKSREVPGASYEILKSLEIFGMEWDNEVIYQDQRKHIYKNALANLEEKGLTYQCTCTRREISNSGFAGINGIVYAGTCRNKTWNGNTPYSIRIKTNNSTIKFNDVLYGTVNQRIESEAGDFIILRSDKVYAYHLAAVVDDAAQKITNIVRGTDLLNSTPSQIYLQKLLGYSTPIYMHLPIVLNNKGEKLSKQTNAAGLNLSNPSKQLFEAASFLGQEPPVELLKDNVLSFWSWALLNWSSDKIHKNRPFVR